ncbi:hypothetical protein OAO42_01700 [Candidatus Izimaplasma bacterium]|nr:hypothetical protein [Candidatus Izimaplasma bacterium]
MYKKYIVPIAYIVFILLQRPLIGLIVDAVNSSDILSSGENSLILLKLLFGLFNVIMASIFSMIILLYFRHHKEFKLLAIILIINGFIQHILVMLFEPFTGQGIFESVIGYYVVVTLATLLSFYMVFLYTRIIKNPEYHYVIRKIYAPFTIVVLILYGGPHFVFSYLVASETTFDQWSRIVYNAILGGIVHWGSLILYGAVLYLLFSKNEKKKTENTTPVLELNT